MLKAIEDETGEVFDDGYRIYWTEQLAKYQKLKDKSIYKNYSSYTMMLYKELEPLLDDKISGATLTRFIYLSTYLKFGEDFLVLSNNKTIITTKNIMKVLKIKETATKSFMRQCKNAGLIYVDNSKIIHINTNYVIRDRFKINNKDIKIMRLYHDAIRSIYKRSDITAHKTLSYLFLLIPYVNHRYNIVCSNPNETDIMFVEDLPLSFLADIWGYDKSNLSKLQNALWDCTFDNGRPAINFVPSRDIGRWRVIVNPLIYYSGNNEDEARFIIGMNFID